jgi:hypothetical protein
VGCRMAWCAELWRLSSACRPCPLWLGPVTVVFGWWRHTPPAFFHHQEAVHSCIAASCSSGGCLRMSSTMHFSLNTVLTPWPPWRWWFCGTGSWGTCPGGRGPYPCSPSQPSGCFFFLIFIYVL